MAPTLNGALKSIDFIYKFLYSNIYFSEFPVSSFLLPSGRGLVFGNINRISKTISTIITKIIFNRPVTRITHHSFPE